MTEPFRFKPGGSPLVVSFPHPGTFVPEAILARMSDTGRRLIDTDWHVDRLYNFLGEFDATSIVSNLSRYVADLNRDPNGHALYPGRFETAMCPIVTFGGEAIYGALERPDEAEVAERVREYWQPYHAKLKEAVAETRMKHGYAVLLDAHSILSEVPSLFDGHLPHLNLGTADGKSCAPEIAHAAAAALQQEPKFSFVANGRFKGGYITRQYGDPEKNVHALQLEISMRAYLNEKTYTTFDDRRAAPLRAVLRTFIGETVNAARAHYK